MSELDKSKIKVGNIVYDFTDNAEKVINVHKLLGKPTIIEQEKLGTDLIEILLSGKSMLTASRILSKKAGKKVSVAEIRRFLNRNHEVVNQLFKHYKSIAEYHKLITLDYREKLLNLQETLEELITSAKSEKDYSNVVALANTMLRNVKLMLELGGELEQNNKITINVEKDAVINIQNEKEDLKKKIMKTVDAEYTIKDDKNGN